MSSFNFKLLSPRAWCGAAVCGVVCSVASLSAVVVAFASASGELEPVMARLKPEPSASAAHAAASKAPVKRVARADSS
jgi:hypothetical protein